MHTRNPPRPTAEALESRRLFSTGDLDPTFGAGGKALLPYAGATDDRATSVAVLAGGSVVVGANRFAATDAGVLLKYHPNGHPDLSFGVAGVSRAEVPWTHGVEKLVALPDGSVVGLGTVAAGSAAQRVQKFTPAGDLDPAWVGPGAAAPGLARDLADAGGGRTVVVAGFTVARLNPDGRLDASFGAAGKVEMPRESGGTRFNPYAAAVAPDGSVVLAGEWAVLDAGYKQAAVRRYRADGTLDTTFGTAGMVKLPVVSTTQSSLNDVQLLPDGRIAVVGYDRTDSVAAMLTAGGAPLASFGTDGVRRVDAGADANDAFHNLAVRPDGALLIGGFDPGTRTRAGDLFLARLLPGGGTDASFGGNGIVEHLMPGGWLAVGLPQVAFQGDGGRFVVAHGVYQGSNGDSEVALTRFTPDGSRDLSFGNTSYGVAVSRLIGPQLFHDGRGVLQPDGKVVLPGTPRLVAGRMLLARLKADGSPDVGFGDFPGSSSPQGDAVAEAEAGARTEYTRAVIRQADGKFLAVGGASFYDWTTGWSERFLLARFTADGTRDHTFQLFGNPVISDFGGTFQTLLGAVQDSTGVISAHGILQKAGTRSPVVLRYWYGGTLDGGFGNGGLAVIDLPGVQDETVADLLSLTGGKLLVAGVASTPRPGLEPAVDRFVARLNPNGALDTTFGGGDGFTLVDSGAVAEEAVALLHGDDADVYLAGTSFPASGARSVTVSRLTADGAVDATFAPGGTAAAPLPGENDTIARAARDAGGRFVFAGTRHQQLPSGSGFHRDFMAVRLTASGAADTVFGPGGARTYDLGGTSDIASDVHVAAGGMLVLTGRSESATGTRWAAVRIDGGAPRANVVARRVFYNGSALDDGSVAANAADDEAVDVEKQPLAPGQPASRARNVTTYSGGINGVMVDLFGPPTGPPSAADFDVRVGDGATWRPAPAPWVSVRRAAGQNGSDRVTLAWQAGAIRNTWLRVTVKATANTGLTSADVFYFGNLVGDAGGVGAPRVDARDLALTRAAFGKTTAAALNTYDFNRDGRINAVDVILVRNNQRRTLPLFTAPMTGAPAAAVVVPPSRRSITPPRRDALLREPPRDLLA